MIRANTLRPALRPTQGYHAAIVIGSGPSKFESRALLAKLFALPNDRPTVLVVGVNDSVWTLPPSSIDDLVDPRDRHKVDLVHLTLDYAYAKAQAPCSGALGIYGRPDGDTAPQGTSWHAEATVWPAAGPSSFSFSERALGLPLWAGNPVKWGGVAGISLAAQATPGPVFLAGFDGGGKYDDANEALYTAALAVGPRLRDLGHRADILRASMGA